MSLLITKTADFMWQVEGRPMGISKCSGHIRVGNAFPPQGIHWWCPHCGRIWASRRPLNIMLKIWHITRYKPCTRCGTIGSLGLFDEEITDAPREVIERELELAVMNPDAYIAYGHGMREE